MTTCQAEKQVRDQFWDEYLAAKAALDAAIAAGAPQSEIDALAQVAQDLLDNYGAASAAYLACLAGFTGG